MKLQDQLTILKTSKKLKELGAKQESLWYWCIPEGGNDTIGRFISCSEDSSFCEQDNCNFNHDYISAFTVAELGEMLPEDYGSWREGKIWVCKAVGLQDKVMSANTEAEARAKMLIYLLENKLT